MLGAHRDARQRASGRGAQRRDDGGRRGDGRRLADALQPVRRLRVGVLEHLDAHRRHVEDRRDQVVGEGRVADLAVDDWISSISASPSPARCRPRSGPRAPAGSSPCPTSCAVASSTTRTSPSSVSTSTTARWAENANCTCASPWPSSSSGWVGRWCHSTVSSIASPSLEHGGRASRRHAALGRQRARGARAPPRTPPCTAPPVM